MKSTALFPKPIQNDDVFYAGTPVPATGLLLVILSNVKVRPRKFPGKSPASQGLQFVQLGMILLGLERLFDLQEAVITK